MAELKPSVLDDARRAKVDAAVVALVDTGDLDRLVALVRFIACAQDAMTDEMIVRLAGVASHGLSLTDQMLALAGDLERSGLAPDLLNAIDHAAKETACAPRPKGGMRGLMGLYALMKDPETQQAIHFAVSMLRTLCRARLAPHTGA